MQRPPHELRYHLLRIAIDKYQNGAVFPVLHGCLNDAEHVRRCFKELYGKPVSDHYLFNGKATRKNVLLAFRGLIDNAKILQKDLIIIFYAGHGSTASLVDVGGRRTLGTVETLCPVDDATRDIKSIPDFTIIALLRALASKKGNNIVFICDSCHAGGLARGSEESEDDSLRVQRRTHPAALRHSFDLDVDLEILTDCARIERVPNGFRAKNDAFVFLAACGKFDLAYEDYTQHPASGRFTKALISRLGDLRHEGRLTDTSYSNLIEQLDLSSPNSRQVQTPEAHGRFVDRILFTTRTSQMRFRVGESGDILPVSVGLIHGVVEGTILLTSETTELACSGVGQLSAQAQRNRGRGINPWHSSSWAKIHRWNTGALSLSVQDGLWLDRRTITSTSHPLRIVTDWADVVVRPKDASSVSLAVVRSDKQLWKSIPVQLKTVLRPEVCVDLQSVAGALDGIAHFMHQLGVGVGNAALRGMVRLTLHNVTVKRWPQSYEKDPKNEFDQDGEAWLDIPARSKCMIAFDVENMSTTAWYVYVFSFDSDTFKITPLCVPAVGATTPCLPGRATKSIGFDGIRAGGVKPFNMETSAPIAVSFIKLYVCAQNVNLNHIPQERISQGGHGAARWELSKTNKSREITRGEAVDESWDVSVSTIVYGPGVSKYRHV
ncbi:hypothetical protein HMN09_00203500 [Mycena chlorophos]|uniref:Peptidase C14 caspase domain-containing protein n=1 Tax=Mycena chlorophos TaxID=658473 RepID=A0A8H6TQA4_MYCCL|nr:hypothetical protein HMN09_00203500 [Mycena chlorophos]